MDLFERFLNRLEKRITDISGRSYTPAPFSFEQVLAGMAGLYQKGVEKRLRDFKRGRIHQKRLPCPVISVGNIVAGGAGKTPMAVFLAEKLAQWGRKPVVISRGYRGNLSGAAVVGDGKNLFLDADAAGDEPVMMADRKSVPVVVGKDRYAAGLLALERLDVDTVILDDGFQHLSLARDLDIVLVDSQMPLGNGRLLPAGRLRELPELCRDRIGCLVITRCPPGRAAGRRARLPQSLQGLPVFSAQHVPCLYHTDYTALSPSALRGRRALLFSGVAGNAGVLDSVRKLGIQVLHHLEFRDHYRYNRADFCAIRDFARDVNADVIITTEKDWVKVDRSFAFQRELALVGIRMAPNEPVEFDRFVGRKTGVNI